MSRDCPNGCDVTAVETGRDDLYEEDGHGSEITYYKCPDCDERWERRYDF
jgi:hypothetical protein